MRHELFSKLINEALKDKPASKKVKEKLNYAKKNWPANLKKYEAQEPAYNVQISTNNQFIATYSVHQNTTDTNTLSSHLATHESQYKQTPEVIVADTGYGSQENYQMLEDKGIEAYVKHWPV